MKNSNENNGKIVPLTDEELKNATGGCVVEDPSEICLDLTESQCTDRMEPIIQTFCRWDYYQSKCVSRI